MMKDLLFILVFTGLLAGTSKADSPLTSTGPAVAYTDIALVAKELTSTEHTLSPEECEFLFDAENPLDHKMAFINALGWGDSLQVEVYTRFLMKKLELPHNVFDSIMTWRGNQPLAYEPASPLSADDYACLAYLLAMGDYARPLRAYFCAYHAVDLKPESAAAAYVFGLVMAQFYFSTDWCKVYEVMVSVRDFDGYKIDLLRPAAVANIFEYIGLYEASCKEQEQAKEAELYHKPERAQKMEDKNNYVDLEVVSIAAPEYISETGGSRIVVKVRNRGTISNIETNARLSDLDLSVEEAKKRRFEKDWIRAIAENNARVESEGGKWVTPGKDYDLNWQVDIKVPVIQPGQETELIFELKDHWIYDSNCEIEVELDLDRNIEEKREDNNKKAFIAWG